MILPRDGGKRVHPYGFDDPLVRQDLRIQQVLHQQAPRTPDGGREILWRCLRCLQPWYALGRCASQTRLSPAQLVRLAGRLEVQWDADVPLPARLCPSCAGHLLGGQPTIEAYTHGLGYRLLWQRARTPRAQFACCVYRLPSQIRPDVVQDALTASSDLLLVPDRRLQMVLAWIMTLADPAWEELFPLSPYHCASLVASLPPASGLAWQGYGWSMTGSPLGPTLVVMAVTFPSACSGPFLLACWRQIAPMMQVAMELEASWS
jgi:hypothetical protein